MFKDFNNKEYNLILRCPTCGDDSHFETNTNDGSVICTICNTYFLGGKEELLSYNDDAVEEIKSEIARDVKDAIKAELLKAFKGNKSIKLR